VLDLYGRREEAPRSPEPDEAMKYWNSEHHRFEFSEYTDVLLNINPLSYHQMGLAVPGTFVDDGKLDKMDITLLSINYYQVFPGG